jgi:hypothetical protein
MPPTSNILTLSQDIWQYIIPYLTEDRDKATLLSLHNLITIRLQHVRLSIRQLWLGARHLRHIYQIRSVWLRDDVNVMQVNVYANRQNFVPLSKFAQCLSKVEYLRIEDVVCRPAVPATLSEFFPRLCHLKIKCHSSFGCMLYA